MSAEPAPFLPPRLRPTTRGGTIVQFLLIVFLAFPVCAVTFKELARHHPPSSPAAFFQALAVIGSILWMILRRDQLAGRVEGLSPAALLAPLLSPFLIGILGSLRDFAKTAEALDDTFEALGSRAWTRIATEGSSETLEPGMMGAILSGYLLLVVVCLVTLRSRLSPATKVAKGGSTLLSWALFFLIPLGAMIRYGADAKLLPSDLLLGLATFSVVLLLRRVARHEAGPLLAMPLAICRRALPLGAALLAFAAFELTRSEILGTQSGESIDPEQLVRICAYGAKLIQLRVVLGLVETGLLVALVESAIGPDRLVRPASWRLLGAVGLAVVLQLAIEWKIRGVLADARTLFVRFHEQPELTLPIAPRFGEEISRYPVVYVPRIGDLRYDGSNGKKPTELFSDKVLENLARELDTLHDIGANPTPMLLVAADREIPLGTIRAVMSAAIRIDPGMSIALLARTSEITPESCTEEACAVALATVQGSSLYFQRPARRRPTLNQLHLGADGQIEGEAPARSGATLMVSDKARCGQLIAALGQLAARGVGPVEVVVEGEAVAMAGGSPQ